MRDDDDEADVEYTEENDDDGHIDVDHDSDDDDEPVAGSFQ